MSVDSLLETWQSGAYTGYWSMAMDPVGPVATATAATSAEAVVVDPRVLALCEEFHDVFTEPAGFPPVRELEHCVDLVDKSAPAPHLRQSHVSKEEEQAVHDNMETYL